MYVCAILTLLPLLAGNAAGTILKALSPKSRSLTVVKAYFINRDGSTDRRDCMESQLKELQDRFLKIDVDLRFERWPAIELHHCVDTPSCMQERPECFPNRKSGKMSRTDASDQATAIRGTIGNWCAHLLLWPEIKEKHNSDVDYFFIMEDDLIITDAPRFTESVARLFNTSKHNWPLIAFDTFGNEAKFENNPEMRTSPPQTDVVGGGLPLYSISHAWGYWGAQCWLLDALYIDRFIDYYDSLHAVPADWVTKVVRPLHLGMLSYQTGTLSQKDLLVHATLSGSCLVESTSDILGSDEKRPNLLRKPKFPLQKAMTLEDMPSIDSAQLMQKMTMDVKPKEIILLGMYNSGTDLLHRLFYDNIEKPNDVEFCKHSTTGSCGPVWKHTNPHRIPENFAGLEQAMALIVTRHPFSMIRAWQRKNYDLECGNFSKSSRCENKMRRVRRPICESGHNHASCWAGFLRPKADMKLDAIVRAWNSYMTGYLKLSEMFGHLLVLRYEDLVENPRAAMQQISKHLSVRYPSGNEHEHKLVLIDSPLRKAAMTKLKSLDYESRFSQRDMATICNTLDKAVLYQLGYHGCQNFDDRMYNKIEDQMRPRRYQNQVIER